MNAPISHMNQSSNPVLRARGLAKIYSEGKIRTEVLDSATLLVE